MSLLCFGAFPQILAYYAPIMLQNSKVNKHSGNYSVIVETISFSKLFNLLGNLL